MALTFRQLAQRFLKWTRSTLAPATTDYYRRMLAGFADVAGHGPATRLTRRKLTEWGTTWHRVQAVQRLFNWAVEEAELLRVSPFARVKRPPAGSRRRILDRVTMARLLRAAGRAFRDFLLASRETLARPQEIRVLRWEYLSWPEKPYSLHQALRAGNVVAVLDDYKSRKRRDDPDTPRVICISPRLGRLLARLLRRRLVTEGPIFLNDLGDAWTANAVRLRIRRLRLRLHLVEDHRGERIVAYTVRHTMATLASAAGVRDRILAELMGHTTTRTTQRYQHLQVEHLQAALRQMRSKMSRGC